MAYSTRRFILCLTLCYFALVFFSPFSIAITTLGEGRANHSAFRTFVRFVLVWFCLFPLPGGAAICDCGTPWIFLLPFSGVTSHQNYAPSETSILSEHDSSILSVKEKMSAIIIHLIMLHLVMILQIVMLISQCQSIPFLVLKKKKKKKSKCNTTKD